MRLLLVEDDRDLAAALSKRLEDAQYLVDRAANGEDGMHLGGTGDYAAVILDIGLPLVDGLSVLETWRSNGVATPVILLTARDGWRDKVLGLRSGADDYLAKPFETEELLARLEALIRRSGGHGDSVLKVGLLELDLARRHVQIEGRPVDLTPSEYRALAHLAVNRGRAVSKTELTEHIYGDEGERDSNVIEAVIARLRKKVGAARIQTRRGHGYLVD